MQSSILAGAGKHKALLDVLLKARDAWVQVALLSGVAAEWRASASARSGLFDRSFDAGAFRSSTGTPPDQSALTEGIACHHLWLSFLLEAWQVGKGISNLHASRLCLLPWLTRTISCNILGSAMSL